jgi:uncharacterized protein
LGTGTTASTHEPAPRGRSLALGIERLGLWPMRAPRLTLLLVMLLGVAAAFGLARLKVDDSLSQLFRSDTAEFRQYEELTRRFPSSEFDVLLVVEGAALLDRGPLESLRSLVTDIQLVEGTKGVLSLFSARQPPEGDGPPAPLFPQELPDGDEYRALVERVRANEIIRDKLLSADGQLALVVVALDQAVVESRGLAPVVGELRTVMDEALAGTGLKAQLSGAPVYQLEIRNAVERDRLLYNSLGFLAGCLIAILFFRRLSFMVIAAGPPLIAILLCLGLLGWLDFRLNMFLNVMTPLIMVIGFADSMQLTYAARERLIAGETRLEAFRNALLVVGPACVLTHATAGLSFVALLFSDSELIRTFGQAGLIAAAVALAAVLTLVPVLGVVLAPRSLAPGVAGGANDAAMELLRRFCAWIAARMVSRPGLYSALAVAVVGALTLLYLTLEPRYRLADQVPDRDQAVEASRRIDAKLTGANPVHVLVELPTGRALFDPEALAAIGAVHQALERQASVGNVWSIETLRRWLAERAGTADVATLKSYVELLPEHLTRRFIAADQSAVVVTGRVPDLDVSRLLPVIDRLNAALDPVRAQHPGTRISVTGLSAIAARNSAEMIGRLNQALTVEILFVAAFIGLAFRSVVAGLASILPGLFPVVAAGSLLWLTGDGLQFASVVALIVSFGLGLSATVHCLNRIRLEDRPDRDPAVAIERATVLVGPGLILTSVVLACGLAVTVLSDLPSLRLFGWLSAVAMLAALVADLLILRPTMTVLSRFARSRRTAPAPRPAE